VGKSYVGLKAKVKPRVVAGVWGGNKRKPGKAQVYGKNRQDELL
jgi:hypothetical protein